jgi:hypothetical protein
MEQISMLNDKVLIKPIFTTPSNASPIINPNTGYPYASAENFQEHPARALVVFAPKYYHVGGIKYESEVKEGDIVYLPGEVLFLGTDFIIMKGVEYPAIRYSGIIAYRTPTEEERKSLVFKIELKGESLGKPRENESPKAQKIVIAQA